jgi:YHS domain-containing protein
MSSAEKPLWKKRRTLDRYDRLLRIAAPSYAVGRTRVLSFPPRREEDPVHIEERIDAELAAAESRLSKIRDTAAADFENLAERYQRFVEITEKILSDPRAGYLQKLADRFDNSELKRSQTRIGYFGELRFRYTSRFPASVTLSLALTHDSTVRNVFVTYDVEILPIFMNYERHDELSFPIDAFDFDQAFQWVDDKIVQFVRAYMELQFAEQYQKENLVTDPVVGVRFSKIHAHGEETYKGTTYYFLTGDSHTLFKDNPERFVSV